MAFSKIIAESMDLADTYAFTGTVTGAGGVNSAQFWVTKSSSQTVSANTWTKITLEQEMFDPDNVFGSNKFTAPSDGYYQLFGNCRWDSPNTNENAQLAFYKNGAWYSGSTNDREFSPSGAEMFLRLSNVIYLAQNDYIELYGRPGGNNENVSGTTNGTPTGVESFTSMSGYKLVT
jgi:hypothetical protein